MHTFLGKLVYNSIQNLRQEPVLRCLQELEDTQWYSADRLRDLQWIRLKSLLSHAYDSVPFYRERFNTCGFLPNDIKCPADFSHIPVLTKAELRAQRIKLMSHSGTKRATVMATSGSSGDPLTVVRNRRSTAYHRAAKYRGHRWFAIDVGAREARLWGVPVDSFTRMRERTKDFLMNRIRSSAYELDKESLYRFYRQVKQFKPEYLFGYTSLIYEFASFVLNNGIDLNDMKLKAVITTSETLHDFQRKTIESAFNCSAVNEFGCTETGIISFQCPAGGMHIPVETTYVEIEPDENLGDGLGKVIVTDLHNYTMPVIRYEIGDIASFSDAECPCGRKLPLLKNIAGRESSIIYTPTGKKVHTILFYYILFGIESRGGGIKKFQIIQRDRTNYVMRIVRDIKFREETFALTQNTIKEYLGNEINFAYEYVDNIPRSEAGKYRDFIRG